MTHTSFVASPLFAPFAKAQPIALRSGKIELFVGTTPAVEAVMAQPVPANQPVLRLTTNTYESPEDYGLFPPSKPVEKTLFSYADADNIVPNGVQGSEAGYLYPLKKGHTFGIRITDKDVEKFLTSIGVERWAGLVADPIRLTRTLRDYLNESLYKDATNKPVSIAEVAMGTSAGTITSTTKSNDSTIRKPLNLKA
jgi:hypothetical protein